MCKIQPKTALSIPSLAATKEIDDVNLQFDTNDNSACFADDPYSNIVNFKKYSIEISINNNEKGAFYNLLMKNFNNSSFLWSNAGKTSCASISSRKRLKTAWFKYSFHPFLSKAQKPNAFIICVLPNNVTKSQISRAFRPPLLRVPCTARISKREIFLFISSRFFFGVRVCEFVTSYEVKMERWEWDDYR